MSEPLVTNSIPTKKPNRIKIRNAGVMWMIHCKIFLRWFRDQLSTDQLEQQHEVKVSGDGISNQSSRNQNQNENSEHKRNADLFRARFPDWLEPFTDNLEETETLAPAQVSQKLRFGTCYEEGRKIKEAQYFYSLPKMQRLRHRFENQNHKGEPHVEDALAPNLVQNILVT